MSFTYDVTTDRGKVRLLATDTNSNAPQFADAEIDAMLSLAGTNVFRAGAFALQTIASNEVLVQKRIHLLELSTDGPSESRELMARAKVLEEQATFYEAQQANGAFDIAEQVFDVFTWRERLWKEWLRDQNN